MTAFLSAFSGECHLGRVLLPYTVRTIYTMDSLCSYLTVEWSVARQSPRWRDIRDISKVLERVIPFSCLDDTSIDHLLFEYNALLFLRYHYVFCSNQHDYF